MFFSVVGSLIISSVLLTDSISSSSFSRVLPPAAISQSPAVGPCCPVRPDIRSTAPLPHPQGLGGGRGNATLVIGKLRGPETRMLYKAVQLGTAGKSVPGTKLLAWVCGEWMGCCRGVYFSTKFA